MANGWQWWGAVVLVRWVCESFVGLARETNCSTAVRYAKALNLRVIAIDIDDNILSNAKAAGVQHIFNSKTTPDLVDQIRRLTSGGVDAAAVFTAVKAGYDLAPKTIKTGGKLVVVGCPAEISFNAVEVALGRYQILGANNHATMDELRQCADFTLKHGIESPSQAFKIDQVEEMVALMEAGNLGGKRLIVVY